MPEGDTIFRTAATMRRWIEGQLVTSARTKVLGLGVDRIVDATVDSVTAKAKHLLIGFSNSLVLHSHMRMTGSWHLYRAGERWRKPEWQAKAVIQCNDRLAVCFNAPVLELLTQNEVRSHISLSGLGPDVLDVSGLDIEEVRRRIDKVPPETTLGELLLDQRIASGIGNIYRCETLFLERHNPWTRCGMVDRAAMDDLFTTAARLMRANVGPMSSTGRSFEGAGPNRPWVYGRTNKPCRVCGLPIKAGRMGARARALYWCPRCQAEVGATN